MKDNQQMPFLEKNYNSQHSTQDFHVVDSLRVGAHVALLHANITKLSFSIAGILIIILDKYIY